MLYAKDTRDRPVPFANIPEAKRVYALQSPPIGGYLTLYSDGSLREPLIRLSVRITGLIVHGPVHVPIVHPVA